MSQSADSFELVRDCRALFLKHFGTLLRDSKLVSASAIAAIQDGAGSYFDNVVTSNQRSGFAAETDGLTSSRISLVSEDQLELELRLENLTARLFESSGVNLWKTHQRFITLLRRPELPKSNNPVGPKAIGQGLETMFAAAGADAIDKKLELLDRIEACLQENLPALYAEINDFLDRGGIAVAQSTIVSTASVKKPVAAPVNADALLELQKALLARLPESAPAKPIASGDAAAQLLSRASLERLIFRLDELDRRGAFNPQSGDHANDDSATLIPALFDDKDHQARSPKVIKSAQLGIAASANEGLAIDTLAMIFEAIFANPRLPDALKAAISSLQITLLKVAMKDSSLFTEINHPARTIINQMAELMLGLPVDVPARHPVCRQLFAVAGRLRNEQTASPAMLETTLAELDRLIAERKAEIYQAAEPLVALVTQRDQQDRSRLKTRQALDELLTGDIPNAIGDFLEHTWRQVLEGSSTDSEAGNAAWQQDLATAEDLIWTIRPKTQPDERKTLARRLPDILKRLKTGMDRVSMAADQQEAFLDQCFALQTQALRASSAALPANPEATATVANSPTESNEGRPVTGTIRSGDSVLDTLDAPGHHPAPGESQTWQYGDWLMFTDSNQRNRIGLVCHISKDSQRSLLLNPDDGLALLVDPVILNQQLRDSRAHLCSGQSLFDIAAGQALQQNVTG